jgi:hypothetical protein
LGEAMSHRAADAARRPCDYSNLVAHVSHARHCNLRGGSPAPRDATRQAPAASAVLAGRGARG